MSDYNSSLPVRTESNEDVVVAVSVSGSKIDPRDIRALVNTDVVTVEQGTAAASSAPWYVNLSDGTHVADITASNELKVAVNAALPAGSNNIGAVDALLHDGSGTAVNVGQALSAASIPVVIASDQSDIDVVVASALPAGTNDIGSVRLNDSTGSAYTALNPVPVSVVAASTGTPILDFKKATAVAAAASDTHTYTITSGKTLALQKIVASGSGKIKVEIKIGTISSEASKIVLFNSTANPNVEYEFSTPQSHADTEDVLIIITNLDRAAQDVYSTLEGYEV